MSGCRMMLGMALGSGLLRKCSSNISSSRVLMQASCSLSSSRRGGNYWQVLQSPRARRQPMLFTPSCSCSAMAMHTKGDQELAEFLNEEIAAETKAQKFPSLPNLEGFQVATDGANVILTKKFNNENVKLSLNVNHTVDTDVPEGDVNINQDKVDMAEMKSKPSFTVEIQKNGKVLEFGCTIVDDGNANHPEDSEAYNDVFNIDEVVIHDGNKVEATYAVSGEIMDGYLYDLLMNMLEERGISNEFVQKLIDFSTAYEHKLYIGFLEKMKSFISSK